MRIHLGSVGRSYNTIENHKSHVVWLAAFRKRKMLMKT